jgi:hypothetical protein
MELETTRLVQEKNGSGQCIYCKELIGRAHTPDCVLHKRTVVVNLNIPFLVSVPASWNHGEIESYINDSSSCADNFVRQLSKQISRMLEKGDLDGSCFCNIPEAEFQREATEDDHARFCYESP